MISVLQALRPRNFNVILLVCSDKLKHNVVDPGDIATENFDWLWQSILVISLSSTQAKPVLILSFAVDAMPKFQSLKMKMKMEMDNRQKKLSSSCKLREKMKLLGNVFFFEEVLYKFFSEEAV
ncbi:hypothetical protein Bca4012_088679 [Brassica carinata]